MRLGVLARARKDPAAPTPTRWNGRTQGIAVITAALLGAGGSVLAAAPATAAPAASTSEGRFLSGSALGIDLDDILSVTPADAVNTGGATVTDVHPLDVTALNAVNVDIGDGLNLLGDNGILTLGAANQYAQANPDGSSLAASGAVTNTGGIGVGGQDGVPQANATLDLSGLIGTDAAGALADLQVEVGAVSATAAQAAGPDGAQTGDYGIEGLDMTLTSPALGDTVTGLRTTLNGLQPTVDNLQTLLQVLGPLVEVSGIPNLTSVLDSATNVTSADGSITANLQTGAITIDVAAVLTNAGLDLNDLPANTQLLPYITDALTTQLLPAITAALQGVVSQLTTSLQNLTVTVAGLPVDAGEVLPIVNPVLEQVVAPINDVIDGLGSTVITPLADALTDVVSLQGNVQETSAGVFTQRALRVGLLPNAETPAAVVNLASASVGPNAGPLAAPTATALTPDNGPASGGTTVTVTGTGFTDDSTVSVDGSDPITPDSVSDDGTSLTFTTPAHAAGDVDVTVTTAAGTSDPLTYTYTPAPAEAPTATALDPDNGPAGGGTTVTVTGTGFTDDATVSVDGSDPITPDSISEDGTELTFTTPAHAAGDVDVTVTTGAGTSEPLSFTYNPAPAGAPTLEALDPDNGPAAGGTTVTVTGTGFTDDSTVSVDGSDPITPDSVSEDGTTLTFTTPAHAAGEVPVTVTNGDVTSAPLTYTYDAAVPTVTAIDPHNGPVGGGTTVTLTGTGFTDDATVSVDGSDPITPDSVSDDGTTLTFTTPPHTAGDVDVTVTTGAGSSDPVTFTYDAAPAGVPTLTALDPDNGPAAGGTMVTVTGTGFTDDSTVSVDGSDPITPDSVAADGTSLTFTTPAHAAGAVTVTVTTAGGTSDPLTYTYNSVAAPEPPVITSPEDGGTVTTGTPQISGTGEPGATVTIRIGDTIVCTAVVAPNGTWTCTPLVALGDGTYTITATQAGDGGESDLSDPVTFTVALATAAVNGNGNGSGSDGALAYTGSDTAPMIAIALLLLLGGAGLTVVRRRHRRG
ncbi:LPXTG-motif cell wall-anchored protein [Curtobacterium pusillum]|uniref:LPXTG-motif cell wall-anchored protein n=1 Tax=Curtobacterium pusillum TaxID=69373 RepID=A0AAW3T360_9MICO|nr:IPT/TIG domain-containing protein [Curtobacterium pusillum]MBA8989458.1 LPXTG-motif cell wall-anchored protein [Curtobacterium pusillum]